MVEVRPRVSSVTIATPQTPVLGVLGGASGETPLTQKFLEGGTMQMNLPATITLYGQELEVGGWRDAPDDRYGQDADS